MLKLPCISPEKLAKVLEKCGFELERILRAAIIFTIIQKPRSLHQFLFMAKMFPKAS
jgi:hypothetical protein